MTIERYLRLIAGAFILGSLALGNWVDPCWYLFTGFVGLNLLEAGLTESVSDDDVSSQTRRRRLKAEVSKPTHISMTRLYCDLPV